MIRARFSLAAAALVAAALGVAPAEAGQGDSGCGQVKTFYYTEFYNCMQINYQTVDGTTVARDAQAAYYGSSGLNNYTGASVHVQLRIKPNGALVASNACSGLTVDSNMGNGYWIYCSKAWPRGTTQDWYSLGFVRWQDADCLYDPGCDGYHQSDPNNVSLSPTYRG